MGPLGWLQNSMLPSASLLGGTEGTAGRRLTRPPRVAPRVRGARDARYGPGNAALKAAT